MNISGGQGPGGCGGAAGLGLSPVPGGAVSMSVLSLQGLEGAEGVGGLWAGGLQTGVLCPALLSPCLSRLFPPAADRDQVPGRPCAAPSRPCSLSTFCTLHHPPFYFVGGPGGWWHCNELCPPQGPHIPPALPLPQAAPAPACRPPRGLQGVCQDFSFLSSSC